MALPGFPDAAPIEGLAGGVLIGCAAAVMLLGAGRIAGVSGMTARAAGLSKNSTPWLVAFLFVGGLIAGAFVFSISVGPIEAKFPSSPYILVVGGLIVGFGTRLGSGCTSGHGVCGMSRMSARSLSATAVFIGAGIVTVAVMNRLGGVWL